jgi:hypothetical protein
MARLICAVFASLSLLVAGNVASATPAGDHEQGGHWLVVGTGRFVGIAPFGPVDVTISVKAKSDPSGEDPHGHLSFGGQSRFGLIDISGKVTCLLVVGNKASVGIVITKSNSPVLPLGSGGIFSFTDNGGTGDQWEAKPLPTPPTTCPPPFASRTITSGHFAIVDGTAGSGDDGAIRETASLMRR